MKEEELKRLEKGRELLYDIRVYKNKVSDLIHAYNKLKNDENYVVFINNQEIYKDFALEALAKQRSLCENKIEELQKQFDEL